MATTKWSTPTSLTAYESTDLNSLANSTSESTGKVLCDEIDNSTNLYFYMMVELALASITSGSGAPFVGLWLLIPADGSTYETGSTTVDPSKPQHVVFPLKASYTGAQTVVIDGIPIPPTKFKFLLQNKAGIAFASSGNTLKYTMYSEQSS